LPLCHVRLEVKPPALGLNQDTRID